MYMLPERLRQVRTDQNGLQKQLAHHLHVSVGTVSNYENGVHHPDPSMLCKIAQFYGVSSDYLLGLTDCTYSVDSMNWIISNGYTVGQFIMLLDRLPDKDKDWLVYMFRCLELLHM